MATHDTRAIHQQWYTEVVAWNTFFKHLFVFLSISSTYRYIYRHTPAASGCKIRHSQWICLYYMYMHVCCLIRGWMLCSLQLWLSLWAPSPSLEEPSVGKSCERGSSNWEKKTTSIHTSCCTLEPQLSMTHPENPLSSQYDTSPAVSLGDSWSVTKTNAGVKC